MKETAFNNLLGSYANRKNTTVEDIKNHVESAICSTGLTEEEKDGIRKDAELAIAYLRETKTMYLAYSDVTVYGASFDDDDDAIEQANEWLVENGEHGDIKNVLKIDVPADAEHSDFSSCAQISDYKEVAQKMIDDIEE